VRGTADVHLVIVLHDDARNSRCERTIDIRVERLATVREVEAAIEQGLKAVRAIDA
jgi:hypothetical protein